MRLVRSLDTSASNSLGSHPSHSADHALAAPDVEPLSDAVGDALASAVLCGIVGGLVFAIAIVPVIGVVAVGAVLGAGCGIVIAYH